MPQQPNWLSLPVEIWLHILGFRIPLRDLGELCLTCSQLLSISRPILYRHPTLVAETQLHPNLAVTETFALLARDADLARNVRELTLDSRSTSEAYYRNPGLIHIPSLRNMTQLKRITIMGDIARHAGTETVNKFIQILHELQLDELLFPMPGVRGFILAINPAQLGQLANPKRIQFHVGVDYNGLLASRFLTLLAAAPPSLTSLSLIANNLYSTCPVHEIFTLHFPHLRSLALVSTSDAGFTCPPGFTAFISTHHATLEELHLGWNRTTRTSGPAALVFGAASDLYPDFLPNLKVFRGDCRNVEIMARARMRCLAMLQNLTLGSAAGGPEARVADAHQMLDALEAAGRLDALKQLDFELFEWREAERDFVPAFVRRFGTLCGPTLEVWRGLLPFGGSWPMDVFAAFPRLQVIRFPQDSMVLTPATAWDQDYDATKVLECGQSLVGTCKELKEVPFGLMRENILSRRSIPQLPQPQHQLDYITREAINDWHIMRKCSDLLMPNWLTLPVDVWLHVLGFRFPLRDLGELCLTCSQLLSITRPILYRHLFLAPESRIHPNYSVAKLFALLARDAHLAQSVRELTLDAFSPSKPYFCRSGEVHITSLPLWNMMHLKRVTILGDFSRYASAETMSSFIQMLHDLQLDELRLVQGCISPGAREFIFPLHATDLALLGNPKRIEWHLGSEYMGRSKFMCALGYLAPRLLILLTAAMPTLTSLSIQVDLDSAGAELFALRFPLLRSLALVDTPNMSKGFSAHPTSWNFCHTNGIFRQALVPSPSQLHPDFLPNLQVFRGDCRTVQLMSRAGVRCLASLKDLIVSSAAPSEARVVEIDGMVDAVEKAGHLHALKKLVFEDFEWRDTERDFVLSLVRRFGALCGPMLEVWRGLLSFEDWLWPVEIFAPFSASAIPTALAGFTSEPPPGRD
ncbi:hypothetical protein DFH09DRAFT_1276250 [Mycena vulgaris]|nr:hypothetical protein DFH09DRAFT_1276250 [Mycena vulgaris]